MHFVISQLKELDATLPTQRKLLLVPNINLGRELLAALALQQGSWIGWEVATLASVAQRLAVIALAERKLRSASDVALADTVSRAFDESIVAQELSDELASLAWSAGTRRAITDAVLELRTAGATPALLRSVGGVRTPDSTALLGRALATMLERYERLLGERGLADPTEQFTAAIQAFDAQSGFVLDHALMVCSPGWTVRGRPRELFELLVKSGLRSLNAVAYPGLSEPDGLVNSIAPAVNAKGDENNANPFPAMFCAANTGVEMREVMRRILGAGHSLDEIEVACTNSDDYGVTIEALCEQLNISATLFDGLPLAASRIGRALGHWFRWIESDYRADVLRGALDSGDLPGNADLAIELRRLGIGWGLEATRRAVVRLKSDTWRERVRLAEGEADDDYQRRRTSQLAAMDQLAELLERLITNAPPAMLSVADMAKRTTNVLELVRASDAAESSTLQRLRERLADIASISRTEVEMADAMATLQQELSDLRVWTSVSKTAKPRRATGGNLHLTNIENAGATGRPLLFIVGLDADRCAGPVLQSPLLPDTMRLRLNERGAGLATTEQRRRERAWQLASAINCTHATLTLSYAIRGGADGRDANAAPILLQVARRSSGNNNLSYDDLSGILGEPVTAIPNASSAKLDARDVWLAAMSDGALLLDARPVAFASFDGLRRGNLAVTARAQPIAGAFHGIVPSAGKLDPRKTQRAISPSSLEMLASCSLRWFYNVALGARVPEEPEFDLLVWLNPLDRGSALHDLYESIMAARLHEQAPGTARDRHVGKIVDRVLATMERKVPVPSGVIRAREAADLHNNAKLFVTTEYEAFVREPWEVVALELTFGDGDEAAEMPLEDGSSIRVHGRVDRVDKLRDGTLRLIDYKTGRAFELGTKRGAFDGGRKLQLAVYSPAVSAALKAEVSVAEYRFPTERGDGNVARADAAQLLQAPRIVQSMLEDVSNGRFLPTIDVNDCKYCDYAAVCRVRETRFSFVSPRASWAKESAKTDPQFAEINRRAERVGDSE